MKLVKLNNLSESEKEWALANSQIIARLQHAILPSQVTKHCDNSINPDKPLIELDIHQNLLCFYSIVLFEEDARFILEHKQGYIEKFKTVKLPSNQFYKLELESKDIHRRSINIEQLYTPSLEPEEIGGQSARQADRKIFSTYVVNDAISRFGPKCTKRNGQLNIASLCRFIQGNWQAYYDTYITNGYLVEGITKEPPTELTLRRWVNKFIT